MRFVVAMGIAAGVLCLNQPSFATDLFTPTPETPIYERPPIWTGFYIGGHIGGLWNDGGKNSVLEKFKEKLCKIVEVSKKHKDHGDYGHHGKDDDHHGKDSHKKYGDHKDYGDHKKYSDHNHKEYKEVCEWKWTDWQKVDDNFSDDRDDLTLIGGVHVGYNWQIDSRVIGVESDISFAEGVDYLASLRGRLGYAMDDFLIYATGGVAFVGFDDTTLHDDSGHDVTFSGDGKIGFVVGGGVDYKVRPNWSVGVEGLYYIFEDDHGSAEWDSSYAKLKLDHTDDNDLIVARARVSYHFQNREEIPLK